MHSIKKLLCVLLALGLAAPVLANKEVQSLTENPNYWAYPGGNYWNWRHSALSQITTKNANKLVTAWTFSTGRLQGHEGGPLVLPSKTTGLPHDTLFIHSSFPNDVFAISLDSLEIVWYHEPQQNEEETVPVMCCDIVNRGLSYSMGNIYLQQADTLLVALDVKTGKVNWTAENGREIGYGPAAGHTATNAPHPMKDKVLSGCSGAEFGVRCWDGCFQCERW